MFASNLGSLSYPQVWQFSTTVDLTVVDLKRGSQHDSHVQLWSLNFPSWPHSELCPSPFNLS